MTERRLQDRFHLEQSPVVANCCMNRERDLRGSNGYEVEIGFDPLQWLERRLKTQTSVRWLDLCCGTGKALIQAASMIEEQGNLHVQITGVDLVGMFLPSDFSSLRLVECSVFDFEPAERFDLVTCVHGLHYLGDKLKAIELAASWLVEDGTFVANLDASNLFLSEHKKGQRKITRWLRDSGVEYLASRHLLRCIGHQDLQSPFRFLGADDTAGPNYTKQPVVNSYYA